MSFIPHIISPLGNITLVIDGASKTVSFDHPSHAKVLDALRECRWDDIPALVDIPVALQQYSEGLVTVSAEGEVQYDGEIVHSTIANRITTFFQQGLDFKPLVRFLNNLMENPSRQSVQELYGFAENEGMAITEDGCLMGYKAVRMDYMDFHTGTCDNHPGEVLEMPRNKVDDNPARGCSVGYHVGSQAYAQSFGGQEKRIMLCKFNPRDAVSVPHESCEKIRVCRYEVVQEVQLGDIIQSPLYEQDDLYLDMAEDEVEEMYSYEDEFGELQRADFWDGLDAQLLDD